MTFISEKILPKKRRKKASAQELLKAYNELERYMLSALNDRTYKQYKILVKKQDEIMEKVGNTSVNSDNKYDFNEENMKLVEAKMKLESRDEAFVMKYIKESGQMAEGLELMRKKSSLSRLISEHESSTLLDNIEND